MVELFSFSYQCFNLEVSKVTYNFNVSELLQFLTVYIFM
jgi:hypothetical protein